MLGGFRTGDGCVSEPSRSSVLLGMMEIPLGLLFLVGSLEAAVLALGGLHLGATGHVILIGDALLLRRRVRRPTRELALAPERGGSVSAAWASEA